MSGCENSLVLLEYMIKKDVFVRCHDIVLSHTTSICIRRVVSITVLSTFPTSHHQLLSTPHLSALMINVYYYSTTGLAARYTCASPTSNCSSASTILAPPIKRTAQNVYHCNGLRRSRHRSLTLLGCCRML